MATFTVYLEGLYHTQVEVEAENSIDAYEKARNMDSNEIITETIHPHDIEDLIPTCSEDNDTGETFSY